MVPDGLDISSLEIFLNSLPIPFTFTLCMSEVILSIPYTSNWTSRPCLSISESLYLVDVIFSLSPPTLIMESSTFVPFSRSAFTLSLVMKQSEAPLSHRTLTQSRFVGIRCICSRQESEMWLSHTLADPEIPCKEVSIFFIFVKCFVIPFGASVHAARSLLFTFKQSVFLS